MNRVNRKFGFTLIELMLAMGFVSMLLIAVALTVIQIGNIYNRGLTLKEVDQLGSSLSSELQRGIADSASFSLTGDDRYIEQDWGGRLCLGQYSYVWNYGKNIRDDNSNLNSYADSDLKIRFVKVLDSNTSYCKNPESEISSSEAVELISTDQSDLAIHEFTIGTKDSAIDKKTGQSLYYIEFIVGTNDRDALIDSNKACKPPSEYGSDLSYCSVNQFNIVVRAGNAAK